MATGAPTLKTPPPRDPLDTRYVRSFVDVVLLPIERSWFRARLLGADRIPAHGPLILAANHSGNAFPYDAMVLAAALWERDGYDPARLFRTLYEPQLSYVWWMRPFGLDDFWRRGGGVDMTFDNFGRLLDRGDRVLYFPEGVPGIGKGFAHRYQLQRFHTSFVFHAARSGAPVLPVYCINAEWVHPFGYTLTPLNRLMQRVFKVPFLPLPLGLLAIVLPWVWYLAFPARMTFVVGRPIPLAELLREDGVAGGATPGPAAARRVAERVRLMMQAELDGLVERYGTRPYDSPSLRRRLRSERAAWWRTVPLGWPVSFLRHDRDRRRSPARNRLHSLLRDWDLVAFYLPLGWPLLSLSRAFRRPPYGYRGLSRATRRRLQGEFLWQLSEAPLPARDER